MEPTGSMMEHPEVAEAVRVPENTIALMVSLWCLKGVVRGSGEQHGKDRE